MYLRAMDMRGRGQHIFVTSVVVKNKFRLVATQHIGYFADRETRIDRRQQGSCPHRAMRDDAPRQTVGGDNRNTITGAKPFSNKPVTGGIHPAIELCMGNPIRLGNDRRLVAAFARPPFDGLDQCCIHASPPESPAPDDAENNSKKKPALKMPAIM